MSASKKNSFSLKLKVDILKEVDQAKTHGAKSVIAAKYKIPKSTLSTIIKNKDKIYESFEQSLCVSSKKRLRTAAHQDIEEALVLWLKFARSRQVPVSGPLLQTKAQELASELGHPDFKCSSGWLSRFKERHGIVYKNVCGESADVSEESVQQWKDKLGSLLKDYDAKDVFNVDETGLFFRLLPEKTMAFKGEVCSGGKKSKERVTVLVGANMDGSEKLKLFVIGKSKNPRCFKHVKSLPVQYEANKKAWMTGEMFTSWLRKMDKDFLKQKRKVLFFVDNCTAHPDLSGLNAIKLIFLPPNTTSKLQPMDQGIIKNLKVHYRKNMLLRYVAAVDGKQEFSVNLLDAIHMLSNAWKSVLPQSVDVSIMLGLSIPWIQQMRMNQLWKT